MIDKKPSAIDHYSMQSMRKVLQKRIVALHGKGDADMRKSQLQYKLDYDRRIRELPPIKPGSYLFIDNPALRTVFSGSAKVIERRTYKMLKVQTSGPQGVISALNNTVTIDDNSNCETVSTVCIAQALSLSPRQLN